MRTLQFNTKEKSLLFQKLGSRFLVSMDKLNSLSLQCKSEIGSWGVIDVDAIEKSDSQLDAWDYCFSLGIGLAGASISTNEQLGTYLNDIHYAASGATGDYSKLQAFLGSLLHHKGDAIDKLATEKTFINRKCDTAYVLFHRLLWGHDVLSFHDDNPCKLMFDQQGVSGILQAVRHLIADTTSKQGLPIPGSSYLDYVKEDGKLSNYLILISQNLSKESVGNLRNAQAVYSHMFTVRAQDIMSGGAIAGLNTMYFKVRGITDTVRKIQFRLISYSVAFFTQAILGAVKQGGVPFVNIPLAAVIFKNLGQLYYFNIKEVRDLHDKTYELIAADDELVNQVSANGEDVPSYNSADEYLLELEKQEKSVDSLLDFFEGRDS